MKPRILIVDDEKNTREGLKWGLEDEHYEIELAETGNQALKILDERDFDLVITDLKMPGIDGMELLRRIKSEDPTTGVIMLTAHGTIETAVEAMQAGAVHYQTKPIDLKELKVKVQAALGERELRQENVELREMVNKRFGFENIVGNTPQMERIFATVRQVAPTRATVLVQGESGTGKELIAAAIHRHSPRANRPFIAVNCGALAETLLESELFGYEKGAFTHALKTKPGRFERADTGTIFLDEIGETSPEFQVKLLRVLETQTFERVGGVEPIKVDVRIIAATNRNLREEVEKGNFREDLFYRLNVVKIEIPPLRERRDDIPLLIDVLTREFGEAYGKSGLRMSSRALDLMKDYTWPGNVRQLRNVLEGLVVMSPGNEIGPDSLPDEIRNAEPNRDCVVMQVGSTISDMERDLIRATLAANNGNRAQTAKVLGIGRKTLYRKMEEYGIE